MPDDSPSRVVDRVVDAGPSRVVDADRSRVVDADRSRVYAVEDAWSAVLDRGGLVDFFGSALHLPTQRRFGDLAAMQAYADFCLALTGTCLPPVRIRARRGHTQAHYEGRIGHRGGIGSATIAIPVQAQWACRESVLLHELAHHVVAHMDDARTAYRHCHCFRGSMCWLVGLALGPEAALLLRAGYQGAGMEVADVP